MLGFKDREMISDNILREPTRSHAPLGDLEHPAFLGFSPFIKLRVGHVDWSVSAPSPALTFQERMFRIWLLGIDRFESYLLAM